jgi:hypothetical protein
VKDILESDLDDLKATILQDPNMQKAMPGKLEPEVINKVLIPKIISTRYPELSDNEIEEVRQHVVVDSVIKNSTIQEVGNKKFITMGNKFVDIQDLNIDLIDQINPFQKAFEYTYSLLNKEIDSDIEEDILYEHLSFLEDCYKKFKSNVNWCRNNQPYILQLRFNYSIVDDTQRDVKIFCPSSFLRPLRFEVLDEKIISYNAKIGTIKGRIETIKDKRQILKVKNKLASIEKESFEKMSFFSTIIIFLVGLITIFTGNSSTITITDKMEYVAVLGVILLLFLCLSYFLTSTSRIIMKAKPWIFTILLILFSIYIGTFFCKHKDDSINTLMQNDATPSMIDTIQFEPRKQ